ncbi:hypothetical protein TNCV_3305691 [Trichonephila clavipes]|nr:hypothetical protein TNCV_3305691 [Trichonephila clavipes]
MQHLPETGRLGIVPTHMSCVVVTSDDTITARSENFLKILYWEAMAYSSSDEGEPCGARSHFFTIKGRAASRYSMEKFDSIVFTLIDLIAAVEGLDFDARAEKFGKIVDFCRIRAVLNLKVEQRHRCLCSKDFSFVRSLELETFGFDLCFNILRLRVGGEASNNDFHGSVLLQHEAFELDPGSFQPFAKGPVVDIVGHSDLKESSDIWD